MESTAQDRLSVLHADAVAKIPIDMLAFADSPRLEGEKLEHVQVLAGVEAELPPILVYRATMTVLDGMHRLRAAIQNGKREISVKFFDGSAQDAFVVAVKANISHGLPLSMSDREAATVRILGSHPRWSDRAIAEVVGLAATTVAKIRARSTTDHAQPEARIGRDGRVRPINSAAGRRLAGRLFSERPESSLREVAELAGISPATALDVRERLNRGDDPVPDKQRQAEERKHIVGTVDAPAPQHPGAPDAESTLRKLRRNPSLRLTDAGKMLLRMLSTRALRADDWADLKSEIPPHCVPLVADLARSCADEWMRFAEELRDRARSELV